MRTTIYKDEDTLWVNWYFQRLFLATQEFKGQFAVTAHKPHPHHEVQPSVVMKEHDAVNKIKAAY